MSDEIDRFIRECLANPRPYNASQIEHLNRARVKANKIRTSRKLTREEKAARSKEKRDRDREAMVSSLVGDLVDYAYDETLADPPILIPSPIEKIAPAEDKCKDCPRAVDRSRSRLYCTRCLDRSLERKSNRKKSG